MMNNEMVEIQSTRELCTALLQTPHYAQLTEVGIFAIVNAAKSMGVDIHQALSGGMYYTDGRVEMSARLMNALIRSRKHSITRDKRSDETICILHGKRSDTHDAWTESFSIEEARRAGLLRKRRSRKTGQEIDGPWQLYPRDMLFARALSRLARQLFPDIIGNCYVEGEITSSEEVEVESVTVCNPVKKEVQIQDYHKPLIDYLATDSAYEEELKKKLEYKKMACIEELSESQVKSIMKHIEERTNASRNP